MDAKDPRAAPPVGVMAALRSVVGCAAYGGGDARLVDGSGGHALSHAVPGGAPVVSRPDRPRPRAVPPTRVDANRLWVDARLRAAVQTRFEAPVLRRLGGPVPGGHVLELGTGRRGTGLRLAVDAFGAGRADGVELYEASVQDCREAVRDLGDRVRVEQGDATGLDAADGSYDAVFGYHVLHHCDRWRDAVAEAARMLRPGGGSTAAK